MRESRLGYLFNCYVHNNYTEQEEIELMALLAEPENQAAAQYLIDSIIENTGSEIQMANKETASILQNVLSKDVGTVIPIKERKLSFSYWMRIAAAVIIFLAGAAYCVFDKKDNIENKVCVKVKTNSPILPGGKRAVLTTSDGHNIIIDSMSNGTLTHEGNALINKQSGVLIYNVSTLANPVVPVVYNTLSTPRGGQYQLVLSDGSKVWLDAASALHFPSAFTGSQRVVELTGEAYFEVTKNKKKPFFVKTGDMQVKVLGTHFNINAYSDENGIKTSLLEGSVKIIKGKTTAFLKPGEQGLLSQKAHDLEIIKVNMDEVMAWKKGLFQFDGADLPTIMREIGRWYNVDIVYTGRIPLARFVGKISRDAELSDVLRILELSKVKFSIIDHKIIVL
ncbi:MAG: FecR family protein [Bacteroidota bacterium]|nr:FecR family protein [Bacteroidota bacterium]